MIFRYFEVTAYKPRLDYKGNTYHEGESLGLFSTLGKAENKLSDWCFKKGISFKDNYYVLNQRYEVKLEDIVALISVAGLFFDFKDNQVPYNKDWDYGSYATITEKELILDIGE